MEGSTRQHTRQPGCRLQVSGTQKGWGPVKTVLEEQRPSVSVTSMPPHPSLTLPSPGPPGSPSACPLPLPHTAPCQDRGLRHSSAQPWGPGKHPSPQPTGRGRHPLPASSPKPLGLPLLGHPLHETYRPGHSGSQLPAFLSPAKAFCLVPHLSAPGPATQTQARGLPPLRGLPRPPGKMTSEPSFSPCEGPGPALRASHHVDPERPCSSSGRWTFCR